MFAVGDKVFYKGRGNLPSNIALEVGKIVNGFLYVKGNDTRFQIKSFSPVLPPSLMDELTEKVKKDGVHVCSYALEFSGGFRRFQVKDVCHARLPFGSKYDVAEEAAQDLVAVALNVSGHLKTLPAAVRKAYKRHVEYIVTQSPWRHAFIQRPLKDIYESGVYIDITQNFSYCVAAAIALRSGSEFSNQLHLFKRLIDLEYSPHVAYIVSQFTVGSDRFAQFGGGHHVMGNTNVTMQNLAYFFNTSQVLHEDVPYKQARGKQYKIFALIGEMKDGEKSVYRHVIEKLDRIATAPPNAWGKPPKVIEYRNPDHLIMVANIIAKEIK